MIQRTDGPLVASIRTRLRSSRPVARYSLTPAGLDACASILAACTCGFRPARSLDDGMENHAPTCARVESWRANLRRAGGVR